MPTSLGDSGGRRRLAERDADVAFGEAFRPALIDEVPFDPAGDAFDLVQRGAVRTR